MCKAERFVFESVALKNGNIIQNWGIHRLSTNLKDGQIENWSLLAHDWNTWSTPRKA